jgi:hypothetical protein
LEDVAPRTIFGSKRDEITRVWKLGTAMLLLLVKYYKGVQIKEGGMGRACGTYGKKRLA